MEGLSSYIIDYYKIDKIIEVDDEIIEKASKYLDRFRSDSGISEKILKNISPTLIKETQVFTTISYF